MDNPVRFTVAPAGSMQRVHVAIRLALLIALGAIGCSSAYWILYLALPAVAALVISGIGGGRYLGEDAPRIARSLRWLASAYAYLWLLTDHPPSAERGGPVELEIEPGGAPTVPSAVLRVVYSFPALLLLAVLSLLASLLWLIGALAVLIARRVPEVVADFIEMTLRYQFRLIAYHLSLVDRYPSLESAAPIPRAA